MSAREVETILHRAGFVLARQSGHRIWERQGRTVPVPGHPGDLPPGTLRNTIELTGMTVEEFSASVESKGTLTMTRRYSIVLTPEPDGSAFNVTSPDIPNLVTFGTTREEALAIALDCAQVLILHYLDRDGEVPEEGGHAEVATIEVDIDALIAQLASEKIAAGV